MKRLSLANKYKLKKVYYNFDLFFVIEKLNLRMQEFIINIETVSFVSIQRKTLVILQYLNIILEQSLQSLFKLFYGFDTELMDELVTKLRH